MIFQNCYEYYFWQAVWKVRNGLDTTAPNFHMDNVTTRACLDAWDWGISFGEAITGQEYLEMLEEPKTEREEFIEQSTYPQPVGNC